MINIIFKTIKTTVSMKDEKLLDGVDSIHPKKKEGTVMPCRKEQR